MDIGSRKVNSLYLGSQKVLSLDKGSTRIYQVSSGNVVRIGSNDYPFMKIGNRFWTIQNLKEITEYSKYEADYDTSFYYQGNYNVNKGVWLGLLDYLMHDGWRVPIKSDFIDLINAGSGSNRILSFLDGVWYGNIYGNNETGFSLIPAGTFNGNTRYGAGRYTYLCGRDKGVNLYVDPGRQNNIICQENTNLFSESYYPVRLCKDA